MFKKTTYKNLAVNNFLTFTDKKEKKSLLSLNNRLCRDFSFEMKCC